VQIVPRRRAEGLIAAVYAQVARDFGAVVEPFSLHSPAPALLAGAWAICRESLLAGAAPRHFKEAVASAVSQVNHCPYCVDAHTMMLRADGRGDVARGLRRGRPVAQAELQDVIDWARASRSPGDPRLARPPFHAAHAPELVGTAVCFHYINRMVSALLGPTPLPAGGRGRAVTAPLAARWFARAVHRPHEPGESLALLPAIPAAATSPVPWARGAPHVERAFSCFAALVEREAPASLDEPARARVRAEIAAWEGGEPAPDGARPDHATALERLARLAALAPYRIDDGLLAACRDAGAGDRELVAALAWASFGAAQRVAGWLSPPAR
jgi:AhpD family alkylhydroperoxidase